MTIIQVILVLVVIGVILWLVNEFVPMDPRISKLLNAVIVIALALWLLFMLLDFAGINTGAGVG